MGKLTIPVILCVMATLGAAAVQGATLHVDNAPGCNDTTGTPFCTINKAILAAAPGDTIQIAAGTYAGTIASFSKPLTFIGAGSGTFGTVITKPMVYTGTGPISLRSLRIQGGGTNFRVAGTGNFAGLTLVDAAFVGNGSGAHGVHVKQNGSVSGISVTNCSSTNHGQSGFLIQKGTGTVTDVDDVLVTGSTFDGNGEYGLRIDPRLTNLRVSTSNITNNAIDGLLLLDADGVTVDSVTITGNRNGILLIPLAAAQSVSNVTFTNVTVSENTRFISGQYGSGLRLFGDHGAISGITVTGSTFAGNHIHGIATSGAVSQVSIDCSVITANGTDGVNDASSPSAVVRAENNYWGCATGPNTTGCSTVTGNVDTTPYRVSSEAPCGAPLDIVAVRVSPPAVSLEPDETAQLTALGILSDGGMVDVTSSAAWTSSTPAVASVSPQGRVTAHAPGASTMTATHGALSATALIIVRDTLTPVPPDPATVAPPLPEQGGGTLGDEIAFLYSGATPIQVGVLPGTIDRDRAAVIRGRIVDAANGPAPAVLVSIVGHPEYGTTLSRADGMFDLAVNGGETLTIRCVKIGFLTADRQVVVPWHDYVVLDDIRLTTLDPIVTPVLADSAIAQVARGSVVTDSSGARRATALFFPGTTASMEMPDGSTQPLATLNIRATEYSVGTEGANAMPAPLPPQSAYTYCVEWSADEAIAAQARAVRFSKPVAVYVENFLGFPGGTRVPSASYDREQKAWLPTPDGLVIRIVSIDAGQARVDTDGDDIADDIGLIDGEREQLALLYTAGTTLWRVLVTHFTPYDFNFPVIAPGGVPPNGQATWYPGLPNACETPGSIIECENQTLGEAIAVTGTPLALHYRSDRTLGRVASRAVDLTLSGPQLPNGVLRIEVETIVAGRVGRRTLPATANQSHRLLWDGRDAYGRLVNGARPVTIRNSYVYEAQYELPADGSSSFGRASGIPAGVPARLELKMTQTLAGTLGSWISSGQYLGSGWTLTPHHFYDAVSKTLYRGDGTRRTDAPEQFGALPMGVVSKVAGTDRSDARPFWTGLGGKATEVTLEPRIWGMAAAADGSVYIAFSNYLRKITPDGRLVHVAGNGNMPPFSFIPPTFADTAAVAPAGMSVGPDGSLYLAEPFRGYVRRIRNGFISIVAGNNEGDIGASNVLADMVQLDFPKDVAVAVDGSLYICETNAHRIRRVGPDGIIDTVAGTGAAGYTGDGGPAMSARLRFPQGIAAGADGSIYILDEVSLRRVGPDGIITTVAGTGVAGYSGDGGPAVAAQINPHTTSGSSVIALLPDGSIVFADSGNRRIRRIDPSGRINTIAGKGAEGAILYGRQAQGTVLNHPIIAAPAPDGTLYVVGDDFEPTVGRIQPSLLPKKKPQTDETFIADGSLVHVFDTEGRHMRTLLGDTGATLLTFSYSAGVLTSIADHDGNVTAIERGPDGYAAAIVAPGGQRTALDYDGALLTGITTAPGETTSCTYTPQGLMLTMTDARNNTTEFSWDALGRLTLDRDPEGGQQTITRTETAGGHAVEITTLGGRRKRYERTRLANADVTRRATAPSGLTSDATFRADGTTTVAFSDGTRIETRDDSDPAWGMQSAFPAEAKLLWPDGRTLTTTMKRTATFEDDDDPLSLETRTDEVRVNGKTTRRVFDRAALTDTITSPEGREVTMRVDAAGRVTNVVIPNLSPVELDYDAQGRLELVSAGLRHTTFSYNSRHELESVTDPLEHVTRFEYDAAGRVTKQILPDLREVGFTYDAAGNLTSVTPPTRPAHLFAHNKVSLATSYTPPDLGLFTTTRYVYNKDRELTSIERADGSVIALGYDGGGRVESITHRDGALAFQYLGGGQLGTIRGADADLAFTYDGPLVTSETWSGAVTGSVEWVYDADLRVQFERVGGDELDFYYDDDGLLTDVGWLSLRRDERGAIWRTRTEQVSEDFIFNGHGETARYVAWLPVSDTPFLTFDYERDGGGRVTGVTQNLAGIESSTGYIYDDAGRLTDVFGPSTITHYTYDGNGNRLTREVTTGTTTVVETARYDEQDRLVHYEGTDYIYTANGELLEKSNAAGTTRYEYDAFGNLKKVTLPTTAVVEYLIDGRNRRVGRKVGGVVTHQWLYRNQLQVVAQLDGAGNLVSRFVYGSRINIPDYFTRDGNIYRILADHVGSPRLIVHAVTGAIAQHMEYDEFGNVVTDTNPGFQPFGFAGGLYDTATELVRFGERDYDPRSGRWVTKDPILFSAGDANLYGYTWNDPINWIDPSGLNSFCTLPGRIPPFFRPASHVARAQHARGMPRATPGPRLRPATTNRPGQPPNEGSGPTEGTPVRNPNATQRWTQGSEAATRGIDKWQKFWQGFEDLADILSGAFPFLVSPEDIRRQIESERDAEEELCGCAI